MSDVAQLAPSSPLRVGVMGAGAVGMFFAARVAGAGAHVTAVGRSAHVEVISRQGLTVTSANATSVAAFRATTEVEALSSCDVVLVSVKTVDTDAVGASLARVIQPDALVVSVQNGLDNAWRLREHLRQAVVPSVVYVSVEMAGPGHLRHNGGGRLIVGTPLAEDDRMVAAAARLSALVTLLVTAGVQAQQADDVRIDLWTKLATNCAYNALSALSGLRYGRLVAEADVRALMDVVTDEVMAVAAAEGVPVTREGLGRAVAGIAEVMPGALSSTAQDLNARRRTEIDDLNGYVVRRGRALGVATPVNETLRALVKLRERDGLPVDS